MHSDRAIGSEIAAVIFEVDGVVVDGARASAGAWKSVFDSFLRSHAATRRPFEVRGDYLRYVHGRAPIEAARAFLAARGIKVADEELRGLAARQEGLLLREIGRYGVTPYASTVAAVRTARRSGIRTAAVSAQRHAVEMLRRAGIAELFDARLDARPEPLLEAARLLRTAPARTAVVAETPSAVSAARCGGFASVIGVDRIGRSGALRDSGADIVVADLSELRVHGRPAA